MVAAVGSLPDRGHRHEGVYALDVGLSPLSGPRRLVLERLMMRSRGRGAALGAMGIAGAFWLEQ